MRPNAPEVSNFFPVERQLSVQLFTDMLCSSVQLFPGGGRYQACDEPSKLAWTNYTVTMSKDAFTLALSSSAVEGESGTLRKPHEMIVMMPRSARSITAMGRRVYNVMLYIAQTRLSALEAMPPADYLFEAPLQTILRTSGSSSDDRTVVKRYIREMLNMEVDWESTSPGDGIKYKGFSLLSEAVIEVRNGENWVSWSYPPTIMSALRQPPLWAEIDLQILATLPSYESIALFEICARYRNNPGGRTSRMPVSWWLDALSRTTSEKREWRKFKNERVNKAVEEINRLTDLEIELVEHRQGRAVSEIQFIVRNRQRKRAVEERAEPVDVSMVITAEKLKISQTKLFSLVDQFGEEAVQSGLLAVERRVSKTELRAVENTYSYLRSILRSGDAVAETGVTTAADVVHATVDGTPPPEDKLSDGLAPRGAGEESALRKTERFAQVRDELRELDARVHRAYAEMAMAELAKEGRASPVLRRRVAQGDYFFGTVGVLMVQRYAAEKYGQGWLEG